MNPGSNEIDLIDVLALILVPITGSLLFSVFSLEINLFGGYDLTSPIWVLGGADISAAFLITVFGVGWIFATNVFNGSTGHSQEELGVLVTALLLPLAVVFVPAFENLVMWHDLTQLMALLYLSGATVIISYTA